MTRLCLINVSFNGCRPLAHRADIDAAQRFAEALESMGARVTNDRDLTDDLRPLSCERLWAT